MGISFAAADTAVTLNLFQGPFRSLDHCAVLKWMLKQIQHDGGRANKMSKQPCTYILASGHYGTLYIGVTSNLLARLHQHRTSAIPGFTTRHSVFRLVRFEMFEDMPAAIGREKQLKRWHRQWKINLIESGNPHWEDLAVALGFQSVTSPTRTDGP